MASIASVRRKLQAVNAVIADPGATEHERANAKTLKGKLERQLKEAGVPSGDWTDTAFVIGRWANKMWKSSTPATPKSDWTDHAHRLGKALRRGFRNSSAQ